MFGFGKQKGPETNAARQMVKIFTQKLDEESKIYNVNDERNVVTLNYKGEHFDSLTFTFFFDDDGASVGVRVYSIVKFQKNQLADAYQFCNEMNNKYRWLKFYVDSDDEFTAAMDAVISVESAGDECYEILTRTVSIVDSVYEILHS